MAAAVKASRAVLKGGRGPRACGPGRAAGVVCRAAASPPPQERREPMGFNLDEGIFGFTPFAELLVGRLAMIGFGSGLAVELATGKPILAQLGVATPDENLLTLLLVGASGATAVALARTLQRAANGDLSPTEVVRYKTALGLGEENEAAALKAARELKRQGDFTSPDNMLDVLEARQTGTAADAVLGGESSADVAEARATLGAGALAPTDEAAVAQAADNLKAAEASVDPASQRAPDAVWLPEYADDYEVRYAKDIELANGRWAMIGFFIAISLEAFSGDGIVRQLIFYAKALGVIDDTSGL